MLEVSLDNCRKKGLIYTKLHPKPTDKLYLIFSFCDDSYAAAFYVCALQSYVACVFFHLA